MTLNKDDIFAAVFILLCLSSSVAFGEWNNAYSQIVHPHQNISINNITIDDIQFSSPVTGHMYKGKLVLDYPASPAVFLNIRAENLVQTIVLREGESYTDNETAFQITASGFTDPNSLLWEYATYNPSARLSINTWKQDLPNLKITLKPQYSSVEYGKYTGMNLEATIENIGNVPAITDISPDFGALSLLSNKTKQRINISSGSSIVINYNIDIIQNYDNHTLKVLAVVPDVIIVHPDGKTDKQTLSFSGSTSLQITEALPGITIQKIIPSRLYTCKNTSVTLIISNTGIFDIKDVIVTDTMTETFVSSDNVYVWKFPIIKSGTQVTMHERMTPTISGSYTLEAATIEYSIYNQYKNSSNTPSIQIISTGKTCTESSIRIIEVDSNNLTVEPMDVDIKSLEVLPAPIQTTQPTPIPFDMKQSAKTPQIPKSTSTPASEIMTQWTPGFESLLGILGLFAAYRLKRGMK